MQGKAAEDPQRLRSEHLEERERLFSHRTALRDARPALLLYKRAPVRQQRAHWSKIKRTKLFPDTMMKWNLEIK